MNATSKNNQKQNRIELIVNALFNAHSGQEVYEALLRIPHKNLAEIKAMIEEIIGHEGEQ